jgi:hypothetical protein
MVMSRHRLFVKVRVNSAAQHAHPPGQIAWAHAGCTTQKFTFTASLTTTDHAACTTAGKRVTLAVQGAPMRPAVPHLLPA